jgi:hypothetical protein
MTKAKLAIAVELKTLFSFQDMSMKLKLYIDIQKSYFPSLPHDRELKVLINFSFYYSFHVERYKYLWQSECRYPGINIRL